MATGGLCGPDELTEEERENNIQAQNEEVSTLTLK